MKIEIDDSKLINDTVEKVVERLEPQLNNSCNSKGDELMDGKQLEDYLQVKESWVREKVHKREIPFSKAGKFPRFRKKDIDLWLLNPYHHDLDKYNLKHNGKEVSK